MLKVDEYRDGGRWGMAVADGRWFERLGDGRLYESDSDEIFFEEGGHVMDYAEHAQLIEHLDADLDGLMTTGQVAGYYGVSQRRVQAMIASGRLAARRIGRDYFVTIEEAVANVERPPGRPSSRTPGIQRQESAEGRITEGGSR